MSRFKQAAVRAAPSIVLVVLIVILCAVACKDAFNDEVINQDYGVAHFDTMQHSLTTVFRMLVGEWHEAMFEAVAETTEATQLWFYGMSFLLSVLLAELLIGVIISQYQKVLGIDEMANRRMQVVLAPIFEFRNTESETLLAATLQLSRAVRTYNEMCLRISDACEKLDYTEYNNESGLIASTPGITPPQPTKTEDKKAHDEALNEVFTHSEIQLPTHLDEAQDIDSFEVQDIDIRLQVLFAQEEEDSALSQCLCVKCEALLEFQTPTQPTKVCCCSCGTTQTVGALSASTGVFETATETPQPVEPPQFKVFETATETPQPVEEPPINSSIFALTDLGENEEHV